MSDESYNEEYDVNKEEIINKFAYNAQHAECPRCNHYPLEQETREFQSVVFCTRCEYVNETDL